MSDPRKLDLREKTRWRRAVLCDKELRPAAKVIALFIADFAVDWNTGIAEKWSTLKLAQHLNVSDALVRKELPTVIARGYIGSNPGSKGRSNVAWYWAIPIPEPVKPKPKPKPKAKTRLDHLGETVLGNTSGNVVAKLIEACGGDTAKAEMVVEMAAEEDDRLAYVENAILEMEEGTFIDL